MSNCILKWSVLICVAFAAAAVQSQEFELSSESPSNEAFIEPAQVIELACAEPGIVHGVYVKLGQHVRINELLFELDQRVLLASKKIAESKTLSTAMLKAANIRFKNKNERYENIQQLAANDAANPEEVENARVDAMVSKQDVDAAQEELTQYRLELDRLEAQIETRRIRSPINGVVTNLKRKPGEHVSVADPVVATVMQLDQLRAIFHLPTALATPIGVGSTLTLSIPESNRHIEGMVEYVAPFTRADSGRVRVDVVIDNHEKNIRSGLRCRIVFTKSSDVRSRTAPPRS